MHTSDKSGAESPVTPGLSFPALTWAMLAVALLLLALSLIPVEYYRSMIQIGNGDSLAVLSGRIGFLMRCYSALLFVLGGVWLLRGSAFDRFIGQLGKSISPPRRDEILVWLIIATCSVLLWDGRTLQSGYFESDDFSLIEVDRNLPLATSVQRTHCDHVIVLLRCEVHSLYSMFGAWPLAWNAAVLVSFSLLLWSGCWLTRECGASRLMTGLGLLMCVAWTPWAQFTTGAYILQKYMQIATATSLALIGWIRWRRTERAGWLLLAAGAIGFACWMNVSGFWSPLALVTFAVSELVAAQEFGPTAHRLRRHWGPPLLMGVAIFGALAFDRMVYASPENMGFLTLEAGAERSLLGLTAQLVSFLATTITTLAIPFPHHLARVNLLWPVLLFTAMVVSLLIARGWQLGSAAESGKIVGLVLMWLGLGAMICLGRPSFEEDQMWPIKYLGLGYFWLIVLLVVSLSPLTSRIDATGLRRVIFLAGCLCVANQLAFEQLCFWDVPYLKYDIARSSKLREHRRTRLALDEVRQRLIHPVALLSEGPVVLPDVSGDRLHYVHPELAFPWGERPALSTFAGVLLEGVPRDSRFVNNDVEVSERIRSFLCQDDYARMLFEEGR
ncbi:MAG: hypothetical protein KDA58_00125 [Planctomycetaceae bacterium]|nr:hypothetical protein [Planctomycetaceae bacterium]